MKILFVNRTLGVKQYHLACALTDKYGVDCYFAHTWTNGMNWKAGLEKFPNLKKIVSHTYKLRNYPQKDDYEVFKEVHPYSKIHLMKSEFDWIYCNTLIDKIPDFPNIWLDIEDLSYYNSNNPKERIFSQLQKEQEAIYQAKIITFGSEGEKLKAEILHWFPDSQPEVIYPYVAKRTIPKMFKKKDEEFSIVYAGSSYEDSPRDFFPVFEKIVQNKDQKLTVYLSNWRNKYSWNKLEKLAERYPNLIAKKSVPFSKLKYEISNFNVGLTVLRPEYRKFQLTYGMKPLEYAYAKVQPVSIGEHLIDNSYGEFGYKSTPQTIERDFVRNLHNFNEYRNLMDNNIRKIYELLKNEK